MEFIHFGFNKNNFSGKFFNYLKDSSFEKEKKLCKPIYDLFLPQDVPSHIINSIELNHINIDCKSDYKSFKEWLEL